LSQEKENAADKINGAPKGLNYAQASADEMILSK